MKKFKLLLILCVSAVFVGLSSTASIAAPQDQPNNTVKQARVIQSSPQTLKYDNMVPGFPQTQTLTITNISGNNANISPNVIFGPNFKNYLSSKITVCDTMNQCAPMETSNLVKLPKGSSIKMNVELTLTDALPEKLSTISMEGNVVVKGEIEAPNNKEKSKKIIPMTTDSTDDLSDTGISDETLLMGAIGCILVILGTLFLLPAARRKKKES